MRTLAVALLIALAVIQYPLWAGKGGWMHTWEMERQVAAQRDLNEGLRLRNDLVHLLHGIGEVLHGEST